MKIKEFKVTIILKSFTKYLSLTLSSILFAVRHRLLDNLKRKIPGTFLLAVKTKTDKKDLKLFGVRNEMIPSKSIWESILQKVKN